MIKRRKKENKALATSQEARSGTPLTLRDAMNRLFDESVWDPLRFFHEDPFASMGSSLVEKNMPSMDVSETDKELEITLDVPSFDPENIDVEVDNDTLIISGKTSSEEEFDEKKFYRKERFSGSFERSFRLPPYVDANKIDCTMKNGTLFIKVPKTKQDSKKSIKINVK